MNSPKIAVCGDVMLDTYWYTAVNRVSPEAPVPVAKFEKEETRLGGAANVANNLRSFGVQVDLFGVVGNDENGKKISSLLDQNSINNRLLTLEDFETTNKLRILSGNYQLLRCDFEKRIDFDVGSRLALKDDLQNYQLVIFSDYNKGALGNLEKLLETCAEKEIFTVVDPKTSELKKYAKCFCLKPNYKEFKELFSCDLDNKKSILAKLKEFSIQNLIVTLGSEGVRHFSKDGLANNYPVPSTEVFDVTGAGDTFTAAFSSLLLKQGEIEKAIVFGNLCAGVVVGKVGTSKLEKHEILNIEGVMGV